MPQQGILLEDQHFEMCPWALGHSASGLGRFANPLVQSDLKVETQQATNTFIFPSSPNTLLATAHRHHFHCMLCTQFVPISTAAASPALSTLAVIARDLNLRLSASDDHFLLTNIAICALRRHHQEVEVVLWDGIIARLRLLNIQARILTTWRHTTGDAHLEHSLSFTRWRLQEIDVGTLGDWLSFHTTDVHSLLHLFLDGICCHPWTGPLHLFLDWILCHSSCCTGGGFLLHPLQRERPCLGLGVASREFCGPSRVLFVHCHILC